MSGILIVRLGAMGDILHALPAVESLHRSFPGQPISWLVAPRWMPLLEGNPAISRLVAFERRSAQQIFATIRRIRDIRPECAFDFQGLIQSAVAGKLSRPREFWGFSRALLREPAASLFYTQRVAAEGAHRVERNLALVQEAGATEITTEAWLPEGEPDDSLPRRPFVLASPFAGWAGKEWPLRNYSELGRLLSDEGVSLVLNVPAGRENELAALTDVLVQTSSLAGLIFATRRALAVVGMDSGPTHLAAALGKPGVAIFGPTDPVATGPFGSSLHVLRAPGTESTYKRHREIHSSMHSISVESVFFHLASVVRSLRVSTAGVDDRR